MTLTTCMRFRTAGLLGLRTLVCKLASVVLSMAGGLIAGKEGPFVHAGAHARQKPLHKPCSFASEHWGPWQSMAGCTATSPCLYAFIVCSTRGEPEPRAHARHQKRACTAGGIVGGGWAGMGSRALTDALRGRWRVRAPRRFGGYFRNDADHRHYVSSGTAAGAPLAGARPCLQ